jgi:hypothetical protein
VRQCNTSIKRDRARPAVARIHDAARCAARSVERIFSEAIGSMQRDCRDFSSAIKSNTAGSASFRDLVAEDVHQALGAILAGKVEVKEARGNTWPSEIGNACGTLAPESMPARPFNLLQWRKVIISPRCSSSS